MSKTVVITSDSQLTTLINTNKTLVIDCEWVPIRAFSSTIFQGQCKTKEYHMMQFTQNGAALVRL